MEIIDQPKTSALGDKLKALLRGVALTNQDKFDIFYLMVAYVRSNGVVHLESSIQKFRAAGGEVRAVVGIDQNTSVQGLRVLMPLCDDIHVYHNATARHTFHPKVYAFEKKDRAVIFVGSNNLTEGGLYTNYETCLRSEYDLADPDQAKAFSTFRDMFTGYSKISKLTRRLTGGLIETLNTRGYLSDERKQATSSTRVGKSRREIFGVEDFHAPRPATIPIWRLERKALRKGPLLWQKRKLPRSDAQIVRTGTSPTGGVRLTQAGWKVDGKAIDQTSFFRNTVFRGFKWRMAKVVPKVEVTKVDFKLIILGRDRGVHKLQIRHKPSGEGGQGNYTTLLSWKGISDLVRRQNLTGKGFSLYGPPRGKKEPFCIEIE